MVVERNVKHFIYIYILHEKNVRIIDEDMWGYPPTILCPMKPANIYICFIF